MNRADSLARGRQMDEDFNREREVEPEPPPEVPRHVAIVAGILWILLALIPVGIVLVVLAFLFKLMTWVLSL